MSDDDRHGLGEPQPLVEPAERELDVPAFEDRAAVEVEREPAGDVDRLDDRHREHVAQAAVQVPAGLLVAAAEQLGELEPGVARRRREQGDHEQRRQEQERFEMHGDQREPGAVAGHALAERVAALVGGTAGLLFELPDRQRERAPRAEALNPEQARSEAGLQDLPPRGERVAHRGRRAEHRAAHHVQHEAVEHRLQPPQREDREQVPVAEHRVQQHRRRQVDGEPHAPHRPPPAARHLDAEVERLPPAARAELHAQLLKLHGRVLRARASRPPPPTGSRPRRTSSAAESR